MDRWTTTGAKITDAAVIEVLRHTLDEAVLILEHWFYRGSRAPFRRFFEDYEELDGYLRTEVQPGDSLWFWSFKQVCSDEAALAHGKVPDGQGRVPEGGAY